MRRLPLFMGTLRHTARSRPWYAPVAVLVIAMVVATTGGSANGSSHAIEHSSQAELEQRDDALAAGIDELMAERSELAARIEEAREEYDAAITEYGARLAALYVAGDLASLDVMLTDGSETSVIDLLDTMEAMQAVAAHDQKIVERYQAARDRIPELERERTMLAKRIESLREGREAIRAEYRRRAEAQLAEQLARARARHEAAEAPLVPHVATPQATLAASESDETESTATGYTESGIASIYADSFIGEDTASGEPYDPAAYTAAHRTLPLGTWVRVEGPGGTVRVRINDRGPFIAGRIIDLTPAAAVAVGIGGLGEVTITVE